MISQSIFARALARSLVRVDLLQIRDFAQDRHRTVDDASFGGGPGMVLKADVLDRALQNIEPDQSKPHVVYLSPQGRHFEQKDAVRLAGLGHVVLVCGHYEGIDERFIQTRVDEELSLGDFVLTGGEIPAMAVMDAVVRLLPGVVGDEASVQGDSFYEGLLDFPHYTRPAHWDLKDSDPDLSIELQKVPDVLRSGHHEAVAGWRRRQSLLRTLIRRPDWLQRAKMTRSERKIIEQLAQDLDTMDSLMSSSPGGQIKTV